MNMKKLLLSLMLMTGMSASAYDYPYLAFQTSDGAIQTVSVESLSLSISDGKLVATNGSGSVEFELTNLSTMYFTETENIVDGIKQVETTTGEVQVFTLAGVSMGTFESLSQVRSTLKNGVYVVKSNGKSYKMNIKK